MKIDAALNFVIPCFHDEADKDPYAYVHCRPISAAAFDMSYRLLIRTFNTMMDEGPVASRFADKFLRDAATALAGPGGDGAALSAPLLNEIGRLSTVILSTPQGWQTVPLQQASDAKMLDEGDVEAAVNSALFFSCVWHISPKKNRAGFLQTGNALWSAVTSPLQPTEWIASLPTSTATASSGATAPSQGITVTGAPTS
jgi:hypothetical protein